MEHRRSKWTGVRGRALAPGGPSAASADDGAAGVGVLELWVAKALAPATAIAAMAKLGLTHPPAGAACFIYISAPAAATNQGWLFLLCPLLAGNIICCVMAMVINNLSDKRQYPLYY